MLHEQYDKNASGSGRGSWTGCGDAQRLQRRPADRVDLHKAGRDSPPKLKRLAVAEFVCTECTDGGLGSMNAVRQLSCSSDSAAHQASDGV